MTAADSALQSDGWELVDSPEGDGRPAYLHRASSIVRNTAPDITWPDDGNACDDESASFGEGRKASLEKEEGEAAAGEQKLGGAAAPAAATAARREELTWAQQLLLDVPTLAVPLPPAAGSSIAVRSVRWPVRVVEYVRGSHAILDAMVEPGRTDVTYRQLVRLDHHQADETEPQNGTGATTSTAFTTTTTTTTTTTAAWKHTEGLAAMEVRLQERLQDTPKGAKGLVAGERSSAASRLGGLVPDDAAHPLSFTKTTMAALALLSLRPFRRRVALRGKEKEEGATFGQQNENDNYDNYDSYDDDDDDDDDDDGMMAAAFAAAEKALAAAADGEGEGAEPTDMAALEDQLVESLVLEQLATHGSAALYQTDDDDFSCPPLPPARDNDDIATAMQAAMEAASRNVMSAANEPVAGNEAMDQWSPSESSPPLRVLVIGLSNCCDLIRFFARHCGGSGEGGNAAGAGL